MTPQTSLCLPFADGEYEFALKLPQLAELQERCGAGVFAIYGRVLRGRVVVDGAGIGLPENGEAYDADLFHTIRLALIGGGRGVVDGTEVSVSPLMAKSLVERYCHSAPLVESWAMAAAILSARIEGHTPKKDEPAEKPAKPKRRSTSQPS